MPAWLRRLFAPFLPPTIEQEIVRKLLAPREHHVRMGTACSVLNVGVAVPNIVFSGSTPDSFRWSDGDFLNVRTEAGFSARYEIVKLTRRSSDFYVAECRFSPRRSRG